MSDSQQLKMGPLVILMINMFIAMLGIGLIIPILPKFMNSLGGSGETGGYLVAVFGLTQFLFSPLAGGWSDKYGRKKMIIIGLAIMTVSSVLFAIGHSLTMLYISRLLGGAGAAFMIPPMMAYIADITTVHNRGRGMGLLGAAMSLGFVIGPGVGGFLADISMRTPLYVSACVSGLAALISLILLPETLSLEKQLEFRNVKAKRDNVIKQFALSFRKPYFMLLIMIFTLTFGLTHFETMFPFFVTGKFHYNERDIAIIITVGALVGTVIQAVVISPLLNRFGEKSVIIGSFLFSAISLVLMLLSGNFYYVLGVSLIFFTATSLLRPAINTALSKMAGDEQGVAAGMNNAYMSIGNILGPALAGTLFKVHINLPYIFGAAILILSLGLALKWNSRGTQTTAV
ncbi:tetracycline resistance MFS efflux pump [Paenibacillus peoriae]|uniref:MFS transporter n=1 Tax=Paenibacillus peoriae TaxID=59893 RepID=UPI00026C6430|nr:tetracycline resistance MFS efflux pump [Paenibacillus peoriae]MEC0183742.1 tetracycline resistance MFS efflux pump [Paenibacillus peoriae]